MKFVLYKEKIATVEEDLTSYRTGYDRHYYLDSFPNNRCFDSLVWVNRDLVREVPTHMVDLRQSLDVMGYFAKNEEEYDVFEEDNGDLRLSSIVNAEIIRIPKAYVRTVPLIKKVLATKCELNFTGAFKQDFEDDWVDFTLKYKIRCAQASLIHVILSDVQMLKDWNNLMPDGHQIMPEIINKGTFYNIYIERIQR